MTNNPTVSGRTAAPIQVGQQSAPAGVNDVVGAKLTQMTDFIKDHFVNGGKLGVSLAVAATRVAQGLAQANTEQLTARLPQMQQHLAGLPTALRAALMTGGDAETRNVLRTQIVDLSTDASLAARTGVLWGVTGLAYAALPLTVAAGYTLGATLGEERANKMLMEAMDNDAAMIEDMQPQPQPNGEAIAG